MKNASHINPLVNPVDLVECNGKIYRADTGMDGRWKVYHGQEVIAQGLDGQIELCAWFDTRLNGTPIDGTDGLATAGP